MKVNGNTEGISELIKALLAVQHEVKNPIATSENPYFKSKYAPLDQIVDLLRPLLTKNGLVMAQEVLSNSSQEISIVTYLFHTNGCWLEFGPVTANPQRTRVQVGVDEERKPIYETTDEVSVQTIGSTISYLRRYALLSLFNMAATSEDDDAESTMPEHQTGSNALLTANPKRISFVLTLAKEVGLNEEQIRTMVEKKYNVPLDKLNNEQVDALINYLRSKKQERSL
ncbi:MAG TPA: ERF family protein [Coprothermobacter proteolyticus]|nr:ERF family protein [Coprothermobacter proteolyticus]